MVFPVGAPMTRIQNILSARATWAPVSTEQVGIFNVTFEPGCRNNWHIHHADKGGGQILICVAGRGWYQEWGQRSGRDASGRLHYIPGRSKATARSGKGQLVFPSCGGSAGRERILRVAGSGR